MNDLKPKNQLIEVIDVVFDVLIKGLGAEVAILEATAVASWLGWPVIGWFFAKLVRSVADVIDQKAKAFTEILIIRFQNDHRKAEYDRAIEAIKKGDDPHAVDDAKKALDRLINRSRP